MTDQERIEGFPRDAFLQLLQGVQHLFETEQDQRNLYASLGLAHEIAERQTSEDTPEGGRPSRVRFAAELVDLVAQPARLDVAITLARRAIRELGTEAGDRWHGMLDELELLQRRHRSKMANSPDLETYREWIGFECRHQYSLTDRFFGREEYLAELRDWVSTKNDTSVRCICALGGGGKSALAWQWVSKSLTTFKQLRYEGAFWCSFYEKNFNFDEFLRRALAFASRMDEKALPTSRRGVEERLLDIIRQGRYVFVLDGLERLMNGYASVATRAVDLEGMSAKLTHSGVSRADRRMVDPRDGAFLSRLAAEQKSKVLITTRLVPADLEKHEDDDDVALNHVEFTDLPGLGGADAAELWKSIAPKAEITGKLEAIFRVCGYHPLVISILARSVHLSGGSWEEWQNLEAHRDFNPREARSEAGVRSHIIGICMRDLSEESYDLLGVLTTTGKPMQLKELADVVVLGSVASGDGRWKTEEQVSEHLEKLLQLGLIGEATPPDEATEYDVHPVVRGAAWSLLTDPKRERFLDYALSEFAATPDRRGTHELGALTKATALFRLLVQTRQLDRAWEMFSTKLWYPLVRDSANRKLLELYGELLPDREPLQLLPLTARRAQAQALSLLGGLLLKAGDGPRSDTLLRWCGALCLQIGDQQGFLDASHSRAWQTMYEGRLFETEYNLREMAIQALGVGAFNLRPQIDCWIGIVLALRGDQERARAYFARARDRTFSYRWWAQGLAEGLVYLEEPDQAIDVLERLDAGPRNEDDANDAMQAAWEQLTEGMAYFQAGSNERAKNALSDALRAARQADYKVIQCFALPYIAEIELAEGNLREAEAQVASYHELDPNSAYALSAADAWRVQAKCRIAGGDLEKAQEYATKAYRLAACDGPPFVYQSGLRRSLETLKESGAYVPYTEATLDPMWSERLESLAKSERAVETAIVDAIEDARHRAIEEKSFEEAMATFEEELEETDVLREASDKDRAWWEDVTGSRSAIKMPLTQAMDHSGISLRTLRQAFEASPHKSFTVIFCQLRAQQTIHPHGPRPVRELSPAEFEEWLTATDSHRSALDAFLKTDAARQTASPFTVHNFGDLDVGAFLKDHKRRIAVDADPGAKRWWDQLEKRREPQEMLVLAERVLRMPAELSEVIAEISVGTNMGLAYAFEALMTRRAIERLESTEISKTEGWTGVEILLRLQDVKFQLGWADAGKEAKDFWERLERDNEHRLGRVLQLAEELARRKSSVAEYYEAYLLSNTENIQAILAYMDYIRHRAQPWDGTQPWPRGGVAERWAYETVPPTFTDASELTSDQVSGRFEILLRRVGWKDSDEEQEAWWAAIQERATPEVMLRLAEELDERRADLSLLRSAQVDGDTENIVAALAYMDFTILKRTEDRQAGERATEHNRVGNAHYKNERFLEAVQSYLEAIKEQPAAVFYTNVSGAWELVEGLSRSEAMEKSIAALREGLEKFPDSDDLRSALRVAENKQRLMEIGGLPSSNNVNTMLPVVTPIALEVAGNLIPLIGEGPNEDNMLGRMPAIRDRILEETGVHVPGTRFRGNETDLPDGTYIIMMDEVPSVSGNVSQDRVLTTTSEAKLTELGIEFEDSVNPLDGSEAFWITVADGPKVGESVWDATEYILRHLESVLRKNLSLFVGLQEAINMLENVWSPAAREIAADQGQVTLFTRLAKALLDEGVPLKEMEAICDTVQERSKAGADMDDLFRAVRALPGVRAELPGNRAGSYLLDLDPALEKQLLRSLRPLGDEHLLAIEPEFTQESLTAIRTEMGNLKQGTRPPVLVVQDGLLRRYVRRLVELEFPHLFTLSQTELLDEVGPVRATVTLE